MNLHSLAEKLHCRLEGDPQTEITGVSGIDHATQNQLTFVANSRYSRRLKITKASAVIVDQQLLLWRDPLRPPLALLRTDNPYLAFAKAIELFYQPPAYPPQIHPTAVIDPSAHIAGGAHVGPYCFIDAGASIGPNAVLHSFVTIYRGARIGAQFFAHAHSVVREFCQIGDRVILQNGVIIGGDGLGFAKRADGTWYKMVQSGPAILEDDVEVQSNACVDRATVGETRVGRGTKIDNLAQIGHASKIGENAMICGQVGLAGSTQIGNNCILAGQVGTAGHLTIGDGTVVSAQSGVPHDVPANSLYSGYPAVENRRWLKMMASLEQLPSLIKRLRRNGALAEPTPEKKTSE